MRGILLTFILSITTIAVLAGPDFPTGTLKIRGNIEFSKLSQASNVQCPTLNLHDILIGNTLKADNVISEKGMTRTLDVKSIKAREHDLVIAADVVLTNSVTVNEVSATSLISKGQFLWQMKYYDDFEKGKLNGWDEEHLNSCPIGLIQQTSFLGGPCKLSSKEVKKQYTKLPKHEFLKISAKYHMFDNWAGEYGYMKINDEVVWTRNGETPKSQKGMNLCGSETADPAFNLPVDITIPHTEDHVTVAFGSSLKKDACHASYGVDDIMLFVK